MKLACILAALVAGFAVAADAAPLSAYGRLPDIEDVALSSDGKSVAVLVTNGDNRDILVRDAATDARITEVHAGPTKIRTVQWAGPQHLVITYTVAGEIEDMLGPRAERALSLVYDVKADTQWRLAAGVPKALNITMGPVMVRMIDGKPLIVFHGVVIRDSFGVTALMRARPETPGTLVQEVGDQQTSRFLIDESGHAVARSEYNGKRSTWSLMVQRGNSWYRAAEGESGFGPPALIAPGRTPGKLLIGLASDDHYYREFAPEDGSSTPAAALEDEDDVVLDNAGRPIGAYRAAGDSFRYTYFDPAEAARWDKVTKAFGEAQVRPLSWSDDRNTVAVSVQSGSAPLKFAVFDLAQGKIRWLGSAYGGVPEADVAKVQAVTYKAADGLAISGYLTLPNGRAAKNLPLIVLPHGGPASRDSLHFDWWAQALAAQGYAVLQPNFRGSDGLGTDLLKAGFGEFGKKMQTDLSDGVRDLAAKGTIDPQRVCIVGASYGGYAALAGATMDTGVYRCAASIAGLSDLRRMLKTDRRDFGEATFRFWSEFIGVDGLGDPDLAAISPVKMADKVSVPILLIHGKDDTVVLYEQSKMMADALKKAGKPVTFVTLDGEDHWLSRGPTRQKMLESLVAFLKANNPPD